MRVPLAVANWKMHKGVHDAVAYAHDLAKLLANFHHAEIVIAPSFTAIAAVADALRATRLLVGAQDVSSEPEGAFTGEVSGAMVYEAGARYVIIGHSERRRLFHETDVIVNRKVRAAMAANLKPIVCIGETLDEREAGRTFEVIDGQLTAGLDGLSAEAIAGFAIAYEPIWAIGTGRNATTAEAGAVHAHIRARLRQHFGATAAETCRVIYGGSVRPDNVAALAAIPDVDGALVGGASLEAASFAEIVTLSRP